MSTAREQTHQAVFDAIKRAMPAAAALPSRALIQSLTDAAMNAVENRVVTDRPACPALTSAVLHTLVSKELLSLLDIDEHGYSQPMRIRIDVDDDNLHATLTFSLPTTDPEPA